METKIEQLVCGECGESKHLLYIRSTGEIITECISCRSQSEITVTKPEILIDNLSGSGTLCVF